MAKKYCQVIHESGTRIISNNIEIAEDFLSRLKGLLGRDGLKEGEGLLLSPCSSIHCFGMKFAIDAVFLNKEHRVVGIEEDMRPGSHASNRQAHYVLELKAGEVQRLGIEINEQWRISY